MKKLFKLCLLALVGLTAINLTSCCSKKEKLYLLNWDEYIDEDLLKQFEKENNCKVIMEVAESNEIMYSNITRGNQYDVVFPSDYMISQMKEENLIKTLDFSKLSNYKYSNFNSTLCSLIDRDCADIKSYFVPYFWGSLALMYNTDSLSDAQIADIKTRGFEVLFDSKFSNNIGMYASSRDSIASALLASGYSLNTTKDSELDEAEAKLASMKGKYKAWATDDLKVGVESGKYDLALVYSGDFFDVLYSSLEDEKEITYDCFAPKTANNVFFDAMVIPTNCQNEELAYKFIDFMIDYENSLQNAEFVGYCPTLTAVYNAMVSNPDYSDVTTHDVYDPSDIVNGEIYKYLGADLYDKYEAIYKRVKG